MQKGLEIGLLLIVSQCKRIFQLDDFYIRNNLLTYGTKSLKINNIVHSNYESIVCYVSMPVI